MFCLSTTAGIWHSVEELHKIRVIERTFSPSSDADYLKDLNRHYLKWVDACYRFTDWYK